MIPNTQENNTKGEKHVFAFTRVNLAVAILGFILMSGEGSGETTYNPAIFNALRIKVAPVVTLFGYLFILYAILYRKKEK